MRYSAIWEFLDKAKAEDKAFEEFEEQLKQERGGFAESTLQATEWLRKYHPERLRAWYEKHPRLKEFYEAKEKIV